MSIYVLLTLKLKQQAVAHYKSGLPQGLAQTRAFDGCISVEALESHDDPTHIVFVQKWTAREQYDAYAAWRRGTGLMDKLASATLEPPHLAYFEMIA